jgi:hypothetical protein
MKKSTTGKVLILIGLIVAIIVFMGVMYSQVSTISDVTLTTSSFVDEVKIDVENKIPTENTFSNFSAKKVYQQLMDETKTELLLNKIDLTENSKCQEIIQSAYSNYVINATQNILSSGKWSTSIMNEVKENNLLISSFAYCSSGNKNVAISNIHVVDDYFDALSICTQSRSYRGIDSAKSIIDKANSFLSKSTLKPCSELMTKLRSIKSELFDSHLSHVKYVVANCGRNTMDGNEACDNLVDNASLYGKSSSEVESLLADERRKLEQKVVEIVKQDQSVQKEIESVNEDDW